MFPHIDNLYSLLRSQQAQQRAPVQVLRLSSPLQWTTHSGSAIPSVVIPCTLCIQRCDIQTSSPLDLSSSVFQTSSPLYSKSSFSVLRRYSDFLWLYETLSANNPGVVVPPVPEKSPFNRFDASFVQQRRLALEKCIQKIANHPVLQRDADLKLFLEHDNFALEVSSYCPSYGHRFTGVL